MNIFRYFYALLISFLFASPLFAEISYVPANGDSPSAVSQLYRMAEDSSGQPIDGILSEIEIPTVAPVADFSQLSKGSVVLTVPGIKPSSLWSYIFGRTSKDGLPVAEDPNGALTENDQWLKDYYELPTDESYREFKYEMLDKAEELTRASDDEYLENTLKNLPGFSNMNMYTETYIWSRNAMDSAEALPGLMERIEKLSAKAEKEGKPFYIWAHSWGTILSHTALHRLSRENKKVKVAAWITCGSPLVPSNKIVKNFSKYMIERGNLEKTVAQPKNVKQWINVWGKRDLISNSISQCPINHVADNPAKGYEDSIRFWSLHGIPDWIRMKNPIAWHSSYHNDFNTYLKSIKQIVSIEVFDPYVLPYMMK